MRAPVISPEKATALLEECGGNVAMAARKSGLSRRTLRRRAGPRKLGPEGRFQAEFSTDSCAIESKSTRIMTLEQALANAQVDLTTWQVDRHVINKWEVGMKDPDGRGVLVEPLFQVKVWLKRKTQTPLEVALREITSKLRRNPLRHPPIIHGDLTDPHCLEISLYDHHFGKLAWDKETGNDYDVDIAERIYMEAVVDLLAKASGFPVSEILFPVGQDFLHVNNAEFTTAKGTSQDVDSRLPRIMKTAAKAVIWALDRCREVAPVRVIWVPGNHDPLTSFFFCWYLEAYFKGCPEVTIDVSETARKYHRYGVNLLGFTHGNEEAHRDLPTIMAAERKQDWAECFQYEWHVGHLHKRKETRYSAGDTFGGVGVRVLPSLSGTDAWHYKKGYVGGNRAAEAYLWSLTRGYSGHFSSSINDNM